jgi:hypothetical protein
MGEVGTENPDQEIDLPWQAKALVRLQQIPQGTSRDMTKKATNTIAQQQGVNEVDIDFLENILSIFTAGSKKVKKSMPWDKEAEEAISKAPEMVQGMLAQEIEAYAQREKIENIKLAMVDKVKEKWSSDGSFHLDPKDPRN